MNYAVNTNLIWACEGSKWKQTLWNQNPHPISRSNTCKFLGHPRDNCSLYKYIYLYADWWCKTTRNVYLNTEKIDSVDAKQDQRSLANEDDNVYFIDQMHLG